MANREPGALKRLTTRLRLGVAILPIALSAPALAQSPDLILPDGRTDTQLSVTGSTTDITTGTLAGGNAYNSFSQFQVGANSTVNLHVPDAAGHLINIVRDGPAVVDGTLNGYKHGRIGGNIVFADSYGFVVGEKGVINVDSLTVTTPTKEFLDQVIDPTGRIDTVLGARLIDGDVPLSPDGSIVIRGKVNARNGVLLKANAVTVDGPRRHQEQFEATVNTKGRKSGGQIVVRNGKIQIVAAGSAKIGGRLKAGGRSKGGEINISAGAELTVLPTSRIEALRGRDADLLRAAAEDVRRATAGKVTLTAAGELSIAGRITAQGSMVAGGAVNLSGAGVHIGAEANIAATSSVPSTDPAVDAARVTVRSGSDLTLAGRLAADGTEGTSGGFIEVRAVNDIGLASTAELSVAGSGANSSAGTIIVFADRNLDVSSGVTIRAGAGTSGDGGFVELSARQVVSLATLDLDLWADNGKAGTLYIDPTDIIIGAGTSNDDTQYHVNYLTNGGNVILDASNSITVKSGYRIDSRRVDVNGVSTGNSGSITLTAPNITVEHNAMITAAVNNQGGTTYSAGDISLIAEQTRADIFGEAGQSDRLSSSITIAGTVTGRNITLSALADYTVNSLHAGATSTITIRGVLDGADINILSKARAVADYHNPDHAFGLLNSALSAINPLGLSAAWVSASAKAYLDVFGTARIEADNLNLTSEAIGVAQDSQVGLTAASPGNAASHLSIPVIVGMVETVARTDVGQATQLTIVDSFGVAALTDTKLNILSSVISGAPYVGGSGSPVVAAVAYGSADVDAKAIVHANTTIQGTPKVTVLARSNNAFSVNAKVYGRGQAQVGGTLAISEVDSETVARFGGNVDNTSATSGVRDVTVQALSNVDTHDTSASTVVGTGDFSDIMNAINGVGNLIGGAQLDVSGVGNLILNKLMASPAATATNLGSKTAGSLSIALGSITADASITGTVKSKGTVTLVSDVYTRKVVSSAGSGVNSTAKDPTSTSTGGDVGSAVAVAIYDVGHYSRAWLGEYAGVEGTHVGINAGMSMTSPILISDWDSFGQVFTDFANAFLANPGVFTSGAKATAESDQASQAGSYNHFKAGAETTAWVGRGAQIVSTGATGNWNVQRLDRLGVPDTTGGSHDTFNFQTAVDIAATTHLESLSVMGNWGLSGNASQGAAIGGSAGYIHIDAQTIAGIADSARVTAAQAIDVEAKTTHFLIAISPSNGKGQSVAGSGLVAFVKIDDKTQASISNRAIVTGDMVAVEADQRLGVYAGSGQLQYGSGASIGVAISIVDIDTDTAAYVGTNIGAAGSDVDSQTVASNTAGKITTNALSVRAETSGTVLATTIAAALSQPVEAPPPGTPSKALEMLMGSQATATPRFNLSISGSSSVLVNALATRAIMNGATVERRSGSDGHVAVQALNTIKAYSVSGSAAVAMGGGGSLGSAAMAGAIALGSSDNRTIASIISSDIDDISTVVVQGLAGGSYTVSAVGLTASSGNSALLSLAGSVSIALIEDTVQGIIRDSDITAPTTDAGSVSVHAYRRTEVSIGGGSLGIGGKSGAGVALTYTTIRDSAAGAAALALISNSTISGFVDLSVVAAAPSRIYSGAAAATILGTNGLAGAFIINDIGGTVLASIEADEDDREIAVTGAVNVKSGTADASDLNSLLDAATRGGAESINDYSDVTYENAENGEVTEIAAGAAILSMAGSFNLGDQNVGASVITNSIHQSHVARISGVEIDTAGAVHVVATDTTSILALGIGVGVATGSFAGQAAIVNNSVTSSISAEIGKAGRRTEIDAGGVYLTAQDAVIIRGSATAAGLSGGGAGIGVGIAVNSVAMNVGALVNNAKVVTSGSVEIEAHSTADILTIAAGVGGGSSVGLAGSAATSKIATNVRARIIGSSDIDAGNNAIIDARNAGRISVISGALGVGLGGAGAGISIVVNEIGGDTEAAIADSTVDADGAGADRLLRTGKLASTLNPGEVSGMRFSTPDFTQSPYFVSGVAVLANSTRTVTGVVITLGLAAGGPAAAILPITTVAGGRTVAVVDRSSVGTRLGSASDILVSASSHSFAGNLAIGGAASTAASAGAATSITTTMNRSTEARVLDSTIGVQSAVARPAALKVIAVASQSASDIATGLAAGLVGGAAGSAVVTVFNATTKAIVEGGTINVGKASVIADSTNGYFAAAGSGAGGLFGGAAGAFVVGVSKNTTIARIGATGRQTRLDLNGDLVVDAQSHNAFTSHAYGAAGAVIGGAVAAMTLVTVVNNDTQALLRDAIINIAAGATVPTGATTTRPAGISVSAFEDLVTTAHTGGGGVAFIGNGLGAAANVIILTSKVQADSSGGSIALPGDLSISAATDKKVDARTVTLGAGLGNGIGASVAVVIAGGATAADAMAELNKDGDGTLAMINSASASAADFVLESGTLSTWRSRAGSNATDAEVQAWARERYLTLMQQGSFSNDGVYVPDTQLSPSEQGQALSDYAALSLDRAAYVLADDQLVAYSTKVLSSVDAAAFRAIADINVAAGVTFTPKQGSLGAFSAEVKSALGLSADPTEAQIRTYLEARYQGFVAEIRARASSDYANLLAKGEVTNGRFFVDDAQIGSLAAATLSSDDANLYTALVAARSSDADFALTNVDAIYAGTKTYRQAAAEALDQDLTGNGNDAKVQEYWAARYNALVSAIENGADSAYRTMAANRYAKQQNFSVTNAASNASEGVYAGISGGSVTARGIAVDAISAVSVFNTAWGGGIGGFGSGVGAAVAFTESNAAVKGYVAGNIAANVVVVNALARDKAGGSAANTEAQAGAGGLMAGIGAAVAVSKANNNVSATVGGTVTGTGANSAMLASALDTTTISSQAVGATVAGGTAVGLSSGTSIKSSTVAASVTAASNVSGWKDVEIKAATGGSVASKAYAGAGGIGTAIGGARATSSNEEHVTASIGNGAIVSAYQVQVTAAATPKASAEAIGVVVSGGSAMGVSSAVVTARATISAFVGDDVTVIGNGLAITAASLRPVTSFDSDGKPVYGINAMSMAAAGTGGILFGANATIALANSSSTVKAYAGKRLRLPNGNVTIGAVNDSSQNAESTGIAAGFIGIGATVAQATSTGSSDAYLEENAITATTRSGGLAIAAEGMAQNMARSVAGAGGVFAGAAAVALTDDDSTATAELRTAGSGYTLYTGGLSVDARRDSLFRGSADAFQASAIGASGADARNDIDSTVKAKVGNGLIVNSTDNIYISATTTMTQDGGGARAGGGGVVAGVAAALTRTTVTSDSRVEIGDNVVLSLNGDPTTFDGKIDIEVFNQLSAGDSATVNAGGYFAGGGGISELIADIDNKIDIGDNVHLFSVGALQIGTASINMSSNNANASLYGVVTGAGARSYSEIDADQEIELGLNAKLEAFGTINLTAGRSGNGLSSSLVSANATTEVYNYALVPISAQYRGDARGYGDAVLTMAAGGQLLAGRDIVVGAYKGTVSASGRGTNHNPYLAIFSTTQSDDNSATGGQGRAVLNGTIYAGINNSQSITITENGTVTLATQSYPWTFVNVDANDVATSYVSYNERKLRYDIANSYNPYADIVTKIGTMLNLDELEVRWRLANNYDIFSDTSPTQEIRRQVETFVNQVRTGSVPDQAVNSVAIGSIIASAGNVTINADTLSGVASVTAKGAPRIEILNQGRGYVLLNKLILTINEGGNIEFTGASGGASGITTSEDTAAATPTISIRSTWTDPLNPTPIPAPDIYFLGEVSNRTGTVFVRNASGNVTILSPKFEAATIDMQVPFGNLTANMGAGSLYETNKDVTTQWRNTQWRPANAAQAVMAVATYMEPQAVNYTYNGGTHDSNAIFTARTIVRQYGGDGNNTIPLTIHGIPNAPAYGHGLLSDIWFKVYPQSLGTQPSQTGQTADWEKGWYKWEAWSGDGDGSGPFQSLHFDVIQRQALLTTAGSAVTPGANEPVIIGGSILLSASIINVNGIIQSGYSNSFSVNIGTAAANTIASYRNNAGLRAANAGRLIELPSDAVNATLDSKVRVFYDVSNDRIEVQNINKGSGGRVYLNGGIISTSVSGHSEGMIRVNGGYATVDIRNNTNTALVLNTINTGEGTNSVVEIVDHFRPSNGAPSRSWWVYDFNNASAPVSYYLQNNGSNNTDYRNAALQWQSNSQYHSYTPYYDLLYRWVETASMHRDANPNSHVQLGEWVYSSNNADPFSVQKFVVHGSQDTNFRQVITGTASYTAADFAQNYENGTDFQGYWQQRVYDRATITMTNTVWAAFPINIQFIGSSAGDVSITSNGDVLLKQSIINANGSTTIAAMGAGSSIRTTNADSIVSGRSVTLRGDGGIGTAEHAVQVQLLGGTLTATSVNSNINIDVRGNAPINRISAGNGDIRLRASGDIISSAAYNIAAPIISGRSIRLDSSSGAIGARSSTSSTSLADINPIIIQTGAGGVLNSTSSAGTYIAQSRGNLFVGRVQSTGAVYLAAAGADGAAANILADTNTGLTEEETQRLEAIWTSLNLLGEATQDGTYNADGSLNTTNFAGSAAVHGYEAMVNRAYQDYWQLRNLAFDENGGYAISEVGLVALKAQMAAQLGVDADDIQAADVQVEATRRFQTAQFILGLSSDKSMIDLPEEQLATLTGAPSNDMLQVALLSYDAAFAYELGADTQLRTLLTSGSTWTRDQLTYTIDSAANPASNTPIPTLAQLPANVVGRDIMLYAPNGTIGRLAAPRSFTFTSDDLSALSAEDRAAISAAGPGDLQVQTEALAGGTSRYTITLAEQDLVVANAQGGVSVLAKGALYVGSHDALQLGGIASNLLPSGTLGNVGLAGARSVSGGDIRLEASGDIYAGVTGQAAISGPISRLTLISETGSIGRAGLPGINPALNTNALLVDMMSSGGTLNLAQAARGIYLRQLSGDLILGNISGGSGAQAAVQLGTTGSIYAQAQFTNRTVPHILGSSLDLRAGGAISFNAAAFQPLQVAITGAVTGRATGNITLLSPTASLVIGSGTEAHNTLGTNGNLALDATGGALTINRAINASGSLTLVAGTLMSFADAVTATATSGAVTLTAGSLAMGSGASVESPGHITITTTGNATIGRIATTLAQMDNPVIQILAGGSVSGNGDAGASLVTVAGAGVRLNAGNAIDLNLDTSWLTAESNTGNLALRAAGALTSSLIRSTLGAVSVTAAGDLDLTGVSGGASARVVSTGGKVTLGTLIAGTAASIEAEDDIEAVALTAGTRIDATTTHGTITVGSAQSGGTQDWQARGDIAFTSLEATGIAGDPGDLLLSSTHGMIVGNQNGSLLEAAGGLKLGALTLTLDAFEADWAELVATGDSTTGTINVAGIKTATTAKLTANASIFVDSLEIGTALTSEAGTTTSFNEVTAGTSMDIKSEGMIDIATAEATGGSAKLAATGGKVKLGTLVAGSFAELDAHTDIQATTLTVGTHLDLSTGGTIDVVQATSGGSQDWRAAGDIGFAEITATGIAGDAGNILVTSRSGKLLGDAAGNTIDAAGLAKLSALTLALDVIVAGSAEFGATGTGINGDIVAARLRTDGDAKLTATGKIDIATVAAGGTLESGAGTTTSFASVTTGGSMDIGSAGTVTIGTGEATTGSATIVSTAGSLNIGSLAAGTFADLDALLDVEADALVTGGDTTLNAGQDVLVTTLDANGSARLDAGRNIGVTTLGTDSGALLDAGGNIDIDTADVGTDLTSNAGITTSFTNVTAGGSMDIGSAGAVTIGTGEATVGSAKIASTAGFLDIATLTTGTFADLDAALDIKTEELDVGGSATLTAGQDILVTTLNAGSSTGLSAGRNIGVTTLGTRASSTLTAGGNIDIETALIGTDLTSDADGATRFASVTAGGSMDIGSAGAITIVTAEATAGSAKIASTAGSLDIGSLTTGSFADLEAMLDIEADALETGGDATLNAGRDVVVTTLDADGAARLDAGRNIGVTTLKTRAGALLDADQNIVVTSLDAGSYAGLSAGRDILLTAFDTGTTAVLTAGGNIGIDTAAIGTDLTSDAGGTTRFTHVTAGGSMDIGSAGSITIGTGEATAGSATIASTAGSLDINTLTAGRDAAFEAMRVTIANGKAGGTFSVVAANLLEAESIEAGGLLTISNSGTVRIRRASAISMVLDGSLAFEAEEIRLRDSARFAADNIRFDRIVHTATEMPLQIDVTGRGGAVARRFDTFVSSGPGTAFGDYRVASSVIGTDAGFLSIARGLVTGTMTLRTALRTIFMNNQRPTPVGGNDVQLFQPGFSFRLRQEGYRTTTDAFIVQFGQGSEVYYENGGMVYAGMSMVREFDRVMQSAAQSPQQPAGQGSPLLSAGNGLSGVTAAFVAEFLRLQTQESMLVREDEEEPAVNLGDAAANTAQQ